MFSAEFSEDFKQLLRDIKPSFEENLIRAFKNEAVRNQQLYNNNRHINQIDNILFAIDDTQIELSDIKFPWVPDFKIVKMSVDFDMLCLDVSFKLGDLRVEGNYEATNLTLQRLLPITNNGKIEFIFKEVTAKGRIGLLVQADSLVPVNYDIKYEPTQTSISVKYHVSQANEVENNVVRAKGEDVIGDTIWVQLNGIITEMLHTQLADPVVEFSVTELFEDEDEQLRDMAKEHSTRANRLLDSLLCSAKDYLVEKNYRSIETPPFNVVYRGRLSGLSQGRLHTSAGRMQDLSTLSRQDDLSLYEDQQKLVVYGSLTLREMKHGHDHFTSEFEGTKIDGTISTSVYVNKIFVKLSVQKGGEKCKTQLDVIRVQYIKDIYVEASGLASLSWLVPKLKSWAVGNLRYSAVPVLERHIKEAFDYAIAKTDCVALLLD